jgi:hypothetical protein
VEVEGREPPARARDAMSGSSSWPQRNRAATRPSPFTQRTIWALVFTVLPVRRLVSSLLVRRFSSSYLRVAVKERQKNDGLCTAGRDGVSILTSLSSPLLSWHNNRRRRRRRRIEMGMRLLLSLFRGPKTPAKTPAGLGRTEQRDGEMRRKTGDEDFCS